MAHISLALAAVLTLVSSHDVAGALSFAIPLLRVSGDLRPAPGHRLFVVSVKAGDDPIVAEDIARFALVTTSGLCQPIGAGGSTASIVPFDRIPVGGEVGEVLPTDAMIVLTRSTAARVALEVGPQGTIAFLYDVPLAAAVRALRLPDGRELVVR